MNDRERWSVGGTGVFHDVLHYNLWISGKLPKTQQHADNAAFVQVREAARAGRLPLTWACREQHHCSSSWMRIGTVHYHFG